MLVLLVVVCLINYFDGRDEHQIHARSAIEAPPPSTISRAERAKCRFRVASIAKNGWDYFDARRSLAHSGDRRHHVGSQPSRLERLHCSGTSSRHSAATSPQHESRHTPLTTIREAPRSPAPSIHLARTGNSSGRLPAGVVGAFQTLRAARRRSSQRCFLPLRRPCSRREPFRA
jgi:hypothetical protein